MEIILSPIEATRLSAILTLYQLGNQNISVQVINKNGIGGEIWVGIKDGEMTNITDVSRW